MDEQNTLTLTAVPKISIEGSNITDIPSFYQEINSVFMQNEDWKLGESLDAFNDLLYGGFGVLKGFSKIQLVWNNVTKCSQTLGYETTKRYYLNKIAQGAPFDTAYHQQKLKELEAGNGQTYYQIILEIIADHPNIELINS